jgi:hemerythrin-like domain-containing protein
MKRSPQLTPLSHDHHQALFVAMQLKRAEDVDQARERFLSFWRSHGRQHFAIEEEILLPAWVEADAGADHDLASRLSADHLAIRSHARRLECGGVALEDLHSLGSLLESHVRFEERELFPTIESALDPEAIARLGAEIAAAEQRPSHGHDA